MRSTGRRPGLLSSSCTASPTTSGSRRGGAAPDGAGCRVLVPYLRGYGPTRFLSDDTPRSGQQAALAHDLLALLNALSIDRALLAGYDWGGRAVCIVAALWVERTQGLVTGGGYSIQDIARAMMPETPERELALWYQYYFHSERGRTGLERNRAALGQLLWRLWSPSWRFGEAVYRPTAVSLSAHTFRNPCAWYLAA